MWDAFGGKSPGRWVPLGVVSAFAIAVMASVWVLPSLRYDLSILPLLEGNEAERAGVDAYHELVPPRFSSASCVLTWPSPLTRTEVEAVIEFQASLEASTEVGRTWGLREIRTVQRDGALPTAEPLVESVGEGTVADAVRGRRLLDGVVLSNDGCSTAVLVRASGFALEDIDSHFLPWLETVAQREVPFGATVRLVGRAPVERAIKASMRDDVTRNVLLELGCMALLLPLLFRTARGVALPLVVLVVALLLHVGLQAALGWSVTIIDMAVPGLIIVLGLCDAVHMMHRFEERFASTGDVNDALRTMMGTVARACVFTSATTGLGFLSLLAADHGAVRSFGLKASMAVGVTLVTVLLLLPALLAVWPVRRRRAPWSGLTRVDYGRPRLTAWITLLVMGGTVLGFQRVTVDSRWLEELPPDHVAARDLAWYQSHFGGLLRIDLRVDGDLVRPDAVAAVDALAARLLAEPDVTHVDSYVEWLREASGGGESLDAGEIAFGQLALASIPDLFPTHAIHPEWQVARVMFRTHDSGTQRYLELKELLESQAEQLPAGVTARVAGYGLMAHRANRRVVTTMLRSFLVSLVTISLFVALIYRSWRVGLISVVPNVLPVLIGLAVTGWLDIPLRIGISMIFCLGLGLAVDDTIHLLTRVTQERRRDGAARPETILRRSLRSTGGALVSTTGILVIGALCYLPSTFRSMRDVGILLTAMALTALLADLFVLPHLYERFGERRARCPPS